MSPINLRVPPDSSKKIDQIKKNATNRDRTDSTRSSISLRIPYKGNININDLGTEVSTPTQTPIKSEEFEKSSKKQREISKKKPRKSISTLVFPISHKKIKKINK